MAKYKQFLQKIAGPGDRAALYGIFKEFLGDEGSEGIALGVSGAPKVNNMPGVKFLQIYAEAGAASGDARGIYDRLYITTAGGGGEALRAYTTVSDVAAATVHGAHISLNFASTGTVTGQGVAVRATLQLPNAALTSNVTLAAVEAEIWSDGTSSDPGGSTLLSCFLVGNNGDATGKADVDTDAVLFDFRGWAVTTGCMLYDNTGSAPANSDGSIKIRLPSGALAYLLYYNQQAA